VKWTTPSDIREMLERQWKSGALCRAAVNQSDIFPLRIPFKMPSAKVMLEAFADMRDWAKLMMAYAEKNGLQLQWRDCNHQTLGRQRLPSALLLERPEQAAALTGKGKQLQLFCKLYQQSAAQLPELQSWLVKRPVMALELAGDWPRLVDLCEWMRTHPNPGIYLRQVNLAGIDSKFIESHRQVLAELFDLVLPVFAINDDFTGAAGFNRRYGFLDKPLMLRLRPLDADIRLLHADASQDVVMTAQAFSRLEQAVQVKIKRIFMVENEINYLAFPNVADAIVLFGSGYGFETLKQAKWMHQCDLCYWGDLDTHGFAILNQLRAQLPHVRSLLMDRQTLLSHQAVWGFEPKQEKRELTHLTRDEADLYDDLRCNRLGEQVRLEQERVGFSHLQVAVNISCCQ